MKVAVICANGKAGRLIVDEALAKGMDVTVFVRGENKTNAEKAVIKDAFDITAEDLAGFDAVVDAFGAWTPETMPGIPKMVEVLIKDLSGTKTQLLVVGGAGSLFVNREHTLALEDTPTFPDAYKPVSSAHAQALKLLRVSKDLDWTYVSPAADFQADGAKTGVYKIGGEELLVNSKGLSEVSYADYAKALVDVMAQGSHRRERISVCSL